MKASLWDKLLHVFNHRWVVVYEDEPRIIEQCAVCKDYRSTMYDMLTGETYWVPGNRWAEKPKGDRK